MEIKKSDFKCICCGNYCYEEVWGENDTILVCYVCKRQNELKEREERKAEKNAQFIKCAELLQGIMRTEYGEILTDIRDYLVAKAELVRERDMEFLGQSAMINLIAIEHKELKEYAEKLGVEL